ncbi:hypothetical protein, partial [Lactococcus lactis]|uniref:hypothetical protein n=1 Tax=Lactococcus lactis TaxID=1358 RepID=UPI0020D02989
VITTASTTIKPAQSIHFFFLISPPKMLFKFILSFLKILYHTTFLKTTILLIDYYFFTFVFFKLQKAFDLLQIHLDSFLFLLQ